MEYNPEIDMPRNVEQFEICVDYWYAKEEDKAKANPEYQKQTREQVAETFACYYPQHDELDIIF